MSQQKKDKKNPSRQDRKQNNPSKKHMPDGSEQPSGEASHDPDAPEKKIQIDDNPDETKRKIPNL